MTIGVNTNYANLGLGGNSSDLSNYLAPASISSLQNTSSGNSGSIFNLGSNPLGTFTTNNYEDDFLMPDCLKNSSILNSVQNVPFTQSQAGNAVATSVNIPQISADETVKEPGAQNAVSQNPLQENLNGYLNTRDKSLGVTENGNLYKKIDSGKKAGAVLGFFAPVAGKIVQLFNGGKFSELFKFKQVAIACPAVALAGFGIGALIDSFVNSQRAKAADTPVSYPAQNNMPQAA